MPKFDAYLLDSLRSAGILGASSLGLESRAPAHAQQRVTLPMLVRVRDPESWEAPGAFEVQAIVGDVISGRGDIEDLFALNQDPNVIAVDASRPAGSVECSTSVPFVRTLPMHTGTPPERGDGCLIAFIDTGIDVLHEAFLDANGDSRVVEIWDQRDNTGPAPNAIHPALKANYGTVHEKAAIQACVKSRTLPRGLTAPLRGPDPREHGTHVASIAAGRATGSFAGGVAPDARIVMVIPLMRTFPSDPFSIGYSSSHVEALDYIGQVALKHDMPVVVNVSLGMNAGAHDGTSSLEAAFDNFSRGGRDPGRIIVKSAGNERGHDGHAKLTLASRKVDSITWHSDPKISRFQDIIECWFSAADECRFRLIDPNGQPSAVCDPSNPNVSGTIPGASNLHAIEYTRYHPDNGDSRLLVTIRPGQALNIDGGTWTLEIEGVQIRSKGEMHAWVERENSRPVVLTSHTNEDMTLSIPGTARTVVTVGAVDSAFPVRNTATSSYGPTRDGREKPDLVAPGTGIHAAMAGSASGIVSMSGTSMAAPHVAGAVALLFSQCGKRPGTIPNAMQVRAALTQLTQNGNVRFTQSDGYGVLDASSLCTAF